MSMVETTRDVIQFFILRILQWIWCAILNLIYRGPNVPLVPIREDCLLDSAQNLAARIRNKKIKSVDVVTACIRRIEEINDTTNCVVANRFEEALKEAEAVDRLLAEGSKTAEEIERDTPFLGVPFTFKDGIPLKGFIQSIGSIIYKERKAEEDADVIMCMKKAGAIPLASTNVPELMLWWETNNRLYGKTRNPYHSQYMAGGSSGGEAALIAAAGSVMGVASDLAGSIRLPAHMCGIFGHFPTRGTVSLKMIPPISTQQEDLLTFGPLTKFATDLKPILKVMSNNCKDLKLDEPVDIKKLRYFYIENDGGNRALTGVEEVDEDNKKAMASVVDYFQKTYDVTVKKVTFSELKYACFIWLAQVRRTKEELKETPIGEPGFLSVLFGYSPHTISVWLSVIMEKISPEKGSKRHSELLEMGRNLTRKLKDLLQDDAVLFYPSHPTPAIKHNMSFLKLPNLAYTCVFNATQLAVTQCPIAQTELGLPVGIQIAAGPYNDRLTIAVAEELEKAFGGWKPPPSQPKW